MYLFMVSMILEEEKSKPIVYSMALAVLFTDVITYAQLMIMNTITQVCMRFVL